MRQAGNEGATERSAYLAKLLAPVLLLVFMTAALAGSPPALAAKKVRIELLSERADLVTGGTAIARLALPRGVSQARVRVSLNRRDITRRFARRTGGHLEALLTDLPVGRSVLTARLRGKGRVRARRCVQRRRKRGRRCGAPVTRLAIVNHPSGGPLFSGPQVEPWTCNAGARNAKCERRPSFKFYFMPDGQGRPPAPFLDGMGPNRFQPYDPQAPPPAGAIATTTTDDGKTVPYVIRIETGSLDRGQYQIAVLYDPAKPWRRWSPQDGWAGKALIFGGPGCGISYNEGTANTVLHERALSRGFAVLSHSLAKTGSNCSVVTQAEALAMTKAHLVKSYGPLRFTFGVGGSGASVTQQWVANSYPGIYDGLIVTASFPDAVTALMKAYDCDVLLRYWSDPSRWAPGVAWGPAEQGAVAGSDVQSSCAAFSAAFGPTFTPSDETGEIPAKDVYSESNPNGVRGTLWDFAVSVLGRRPENVWTASERKAGIGFANRPLDNVGVQYGLKALLDGRITPAQFVDLNAKVGGHDIDYASQPERTQGDANALSTVYRSGLMNQASNLESVPIIDLRAPSNTELHDTYQSWSMRARLDRANGHHRNQVIWVGPPSTGFNFTGGDVSFETEAFDLMDRWLRAVVTDRSTRSRAQKVIANKPEDAVDRCTSGAGTPAPCVIPPSGSPRLGAGEPLTGDRLKCRLKPLARADHPVIFSDALWEQLRQTFRDGVCDWTKPGVGQQPTRAWLTYKHGPGGQPLGPAPRSALRCPGSKVRLRLLAPRGQRLRSARITIARRRARVVRGPALRRLITVPRRIRGRVKVRVKARTTRGRRLTSTRAYRFCSGTVTARTRLRSKASARHRGSAPR